MQIKNLKQIHKNQREKKTHVPLKKIIKPQWKKQKEEMNREKLSKQQKTKQQNSNAYIPIDNYLRTKCYNQKYDK